MMPPVIQTCVWSGHRTGSGLSENEESNKTTTDEEDEQNNNDNEDKQNEDEHNDNDGDEVAQAVPANRRSNARYGLRQNPRPN